MADLSVSEVSICNMALSKVGASSKIESLDEASAEAGECNLWYTFTRRQALAAMDWSFARTRLTLATHADDPPDGVWGYRYQYPSDCVLGGFRKIESPVSGSGVWSPEEKALVSMADAIPYTVELNPDETTHSILTNLDNAVGVYTKDLVTTTLFPPAFVIAFATLLGANISWTLTKKTKLEDKLVTRAIGLIQSAGAVDGNEQVSTPPRMADWHRAR